MDFKEKYCLNDKSTLPENKDKITLSSDAYAIGEMLQNIINELGRVAYLK